MFCLEINVSGLRTNQLPKAGDEFGTPLGMGLVHECQIKYKGRPNDTCKPESMIIWWTI
ncbi:hypothetical protein [Pacificibacter marinus]|uniref:Uncharacterized protein n=1 Tax=Pacificibacter marinus TaxID=658057 RepID=A0A1Y5SNT0_9RHOB|nr:hypothetical protein [Pacificibacter marinus]SEK60510.1 hypothetical protein SAMN04488032_104106 [Pacificibacter marinus]SLN41957.1 hypothetical protein PAM7971_01971 [Pacificibacter marinus]